MSAEPRSRIPGPAPLRPRDPVAPAMLTERRLHAAELALEAAHARAVAAERHHTELESERRRLLAELASARHALGERDRARRLAEQREHAERAERLELQREIAALSRGREPADGRADATAERIRELEADREALEHRLVEAEHLQGAAQAARRRAEAELERRPAGAALLGTASVLRAEAELARADAPEHPAAPVPAPLVGAAPELLRERRMVAVRSAPRRATVGASGRLGEVLDLIGAELAVLGSALLQAREARSAAQARAELAEHELDASRRRAADAYAALGALRTDLAAAGTAQPGAPERPIVLTPPLSRPAPVPDVESPRPRGDAPTLEVGRLDAARRRLRAASTDPEPPANSEWIGRALRSLCAEDPVAAGRLVLALLPLHALNGDGPVRYDLVLSDAGVLCVDIPGAGGAVTVAPAEQARAATEVDFAFRGDLAALGRFAVAGGAGRWRRGRGRITGEKAAARRLGRLAAAPVRWRALLAGGVELDAWLALMLAARAIDPAQTRGERFAIEFSDPGGGPRLLLQIADGRRPAVAQAPFNAPAGSIEVRLPAADLGPLLAGVPGTAAHVAGDARALELVQGWIELAQSG